MERSEFDEFAWFVGIFEGEGSILARKGVTGNPKRYLRIQVSMTDHDVIYRVHQVAGRGAIDMNSGTKVDRRPNRRPEHWKKPLRWRAEGNDAYQLLIRMLPYLGARRADRAREVLRITGYVNEDQLELTS